MEPQIYERIFSFMELKGYHNNFPEKRMNQILRGKELNKWLGVYLKVSLY